MNSHYFYRDLAVLEDFEHVVDVNHHLQMPSDWWVIVADVSNSTKAIETGAYKEVNTVGVACIAAVLNVDRRIDIPFVFGGDGATFAVPDEMLDGVMAALRQAQRMARESFGLTLRVGLVRGMDLLERGLWTRIAKVRLSPHVVQAAFSGRGWKEADRLIKSPQEQRVLRVHENQGPCEGSFEGFECRWQNVPSFLDHNLALMVVALSSQEKAGNETYRSVLDAIGRIYGKASDYHPLSEQSMRLSFNSQHLRHEWRVRSSQRLVGGRIRYAMRLFSLNLIGKYFIAFKKDTPKVRWSKYVKEMLDNSDFRKFDGSLRMVIDGSEAQFLALQSYLDDMHQQGHLVYGMHRSREALLTCIVSSYNGNHMHFVDGSAGGYATAARELKVQLAKVRPAWAL